MLATTLEKALYIKYLEHNNGDKLLASSIMDQGDLSQEHTEQLVEDVRVINAMDRYENTYSVMKGEYGNTATYWATYVYFINRVYCELLCTVRTNDIFEGYINVLPSVINILVFTE